MSGTSLFGTVFGSYKGMNVYALTDQETRMAQTQIKKGIHDFGAAVEAKGLTTDSSDCTYLFPEVIKQAPLPSSAPQLGLTMDNRIGWANTTTHKMEQRRYIAPGTITCCDEIPLAPKQLPPTKRTYGVVTLAVAYDSCALDHYIECGPDGYSLLRTDQDNQRLAMEALSYTASNIAFKGDSDQNVMGFANNPDIPQMMMPSTRAMGMAWVESLMSALSWIRNANATWEAGMQPTKFILALPPTIADILSRKQALTGTANAVNVLTYWLNGGITGNEQPVPGVTVAIRVIPELEYIMGGPMGILMEDRPGLLPWIRPTFDQAMNPTAGSGGSPYVISPPLITGHFKQEVAIVTRVGSVVPTMLDRIIKLKFPRVPMGDASIYARDYLYSQQRGNCPA